MMFPEMRIIGIIEPEMSCFSLCKGKAKGLKPLMMNTRKCFMVVERKGKGGKKDELEK